MKLINSAKLKNIAGINRKIIIVFLSPLKTALKYKKKIFK